MAGRASGLWLTAGGCGGWWVVGYVGMCDCAGGTGLSRTMPVADAAAGPWGGPLRFGRAPGGRRGADGGGTAEVLRRRAAGEDPLTSGWVWGGGRA